MKNRRNQNQPTNRDVAELYEVLAEIDPDIDPDQRSRVLMAVFNETEGSKKGFDLANAWASGENKSCGIDDATIK